MLRKRNDQESRSVYDFYLGGAVAHDENAIEWRDRLEKALPMFKFFNPLKAEEKDAKKSETLKNIVSKLKNTGYTSTTIREILRKLRQLADDGSLYALEDLKALMWEIVIPNDMAGVSQSKALIVYIKQDKRVCGTFIEMYEAFLLQGKPVYMISELPYMEMNNWEIALTSIVFRSTKQLIEYFSNETNQAKIRRLA